jgi:DNA-binding response OmpR family regulator
MKERKKTILIVDDDVYIRRPLEFILREEGYEPLTASNGEEGLRKAGEVRPDLIFLDVMMPGLDGFTVCRRLKSDPDLAHIPVILLSARGQEDDRDRGLGVGASDFMTKPYSPAELVRRVQELLGETVS